MIAAIGFKNPLHDDFTPFVLEIDIDVGRLSAFFRDEPLEQKIIAPGIDGGDAKDIANGGVGRRAAALAQNVLATGEANDGIHGQKVGAYLRVSISCSSCLMVATTLLGTPSG